MRTLLLFFLLLPVFAISQHTLSVTVYNVPSSEGKVSVAMYDSASSFLKFEEVAKSGSTSAKEGMITLTFEDVPEGEYAIALFHDKNGNNALDTNWLGIPKEKVAFSKAKMRTFGPPKYEDCAFKITSDDKISIYF
ncbi:DUF2141 domain-containing protein [Flagellimonas meridianipacifica]|uniref:Uncharacterized protein (DUF2141 family) n=1 Tax=Flagellimonas meridianipacifica TaxID=1080225 RepID=A0A2T0MHX9_9FLAO|nr:DUF2141 domain-containing protein [Allomuricauda pacifica]PRX57155.1 uncharacterized protein (DUF2141 family) [Allomuricauda pacifica]